MKTGTPQFDKHIQIFTNSIYDWKSKQFGNWSPEYFVIDRAEFDNDSDNPTPSSLPLPAQR